MCIRDSRNVLDGLKSDFFEQPRRDNATLLFGLCRGDLRNDGQHDARIITHHGETVDATDLRAGVPKHLIVLTALEIVISELLFDRIDMHVEVAGVTAADLTLPPAAEGNADVAARVAAARQV